MSRQHLQELAKRHLWMHMSHMGDYAKADVPIIVRGDGCYVWDENGKRYFDGLSAMFCANLGHGRADLVEAGLAQARKLGFFPIWSFAHPPAIELAARIADLAPGDLNRVFFSSGGSEAVETAIKLARQYHKATGHPTKIKLIARDAAYHGTSLGALTVTGITPLRAPFEPFTPGGCHVPNTNVYRLVAGRTAETLADAIAERIEFEDPDTVAAVIMEPVQNSGGCLTPPEGYFAQVRETCDFYNVLLISDEVICAWGRIGEYFGCQRYDYHPDIITTAKGLTSGYAPMGAVIATDRVMAPFLEEGAWFAHGFTFGGHPVAAAIALANIAAFEAEGILDNVRRNEGALHDALSGLEDLEIVGDVRGAGYFWALELVKDRATRATFSTEETAELLGGFLMNELMRRGLICRVGNQGDPVVQLAPPLIAGPEEFDEIVGALRPALEEVEKRIVRAPGWEARRDIS